MKPWLTEFANRNVNGPTLNQIRRKVRDQVTIDDFVELFAIAYLQVQHRGEAGLLPMHFVPIPLRNVSTHNSPDKPQQTRADVTTLVVLEKLKKKGIWPCKRDRLNLFVKNTELNALRVYQSRGVNHCCVKVRYKGKYQEKTIEKKGLLKPSTMTVGSQWDKRVVCIFNVDHFMHLKELLDCD